MNASLETLLNLQNFTMKSLTNWREITERKRKELEETTRKMDKKIYDLELLTGMSNTLAETVFWCMV